MYSSSVHLRLLSTPKGLWPCQLHYIKKYLKEKKNYENSNIFTMQKHDLLKKTTILQDIIINSITNLQFPNTSPKYHLSKKSSFRNRPIYYHTLNTISFCLGKARPTTKTRATYFFSSWIKKHPTNTPPMPSLQRISFSSFSSQQQISKPTTLYY